MFQRGTVVPSNVLRGDRSEMKPWIHCWLKKSLQVVLFLFACAFQMFAQDQKPKPPSDSTARMTKEFEIISLYPSLPPTSPLSIKTGIEGFDGYLSQQFPLNVSEYGSGLLRLSLTTPPPLDAQQKLTLATCWTNDLRRQQEYHTFRMILGSIQMGGAAYLAYRYLKKYGLK
jgi:hypothetical protein